MDKYIGDQRATFNALLRLGDFLRNFDQDNGDETSWTAKLQETIALAKHKNGWFTKENVHFALKSWGALLTKSSLSEWMNRFSIPSTKSSTQKTIALIMAGNIPLVGFHDFLCVLLTGHKVLGKLSSNDTLLISFIKDYLFYIEPSLKNKIEFVEGKIEGFDAVIATGSNNTARYFEYYFGKVPHIIRKNRNSVAVLTGEETPEQLNALGEDVFRYFGLGCRSVSKIFIPLGYDFETLFKELYAFHPIINEAKYAHNYDYNKAVYLMSDFQLRDNGFLILKEDGGYASPIACLFYESYDNADTLKMRLRSDWDELQCVVSDNFIEDSVAFGETQRPKLYDYADGVDTVDFLLKISQK